MNDAEFRRIVDEAAGRFNISDIAARTRKVVRAGREKRALCAFHDERSPSMNLNDAKGTFHCFGCGASGDIITYVMLTEGLDFMGALRWLGASDLPPANPSQRAKEAEEDAADRERAIADARWMWSECVSAEGTMAETYLREARGITMEIPPAVRFGMVPTSRDEETGTWRRPYPAMVCSCTDVSGEVVGLQRIFLSDDGRSKRWGKKSKLSLGRPKGAATKIEPLMSAASFEVVVCEGPEDGLSLAQELPDLKIWIALGTAMMPALRFPSCTFDVTIAGQNDAAGRLAVEKAGAAIVDRGMRVKTMFPREGYKDWNDMLRGIRS